jgi:hypothetical protein
MTNPEKPDDLPPIPFWLARSTYAMILTAVTTLAAAFNIDILARFGTTEGGILAAVDAALPLASAAWLWFERRNPHFRIGV